MCAGSALRAVRSIGPRHEINYNEQPALTCGQFHARHESYNGFEVVVLNAPAHAKSRATSDYRIPDSTIRGTCRGADGGRKRPESAPRANECGFPFTALLQFDQGLLLGRQGDRRYAREC